MSDPSGREEREWTRVPSSPEALLEKTPLGLKVASEGWFVLNPRDAVWAQSPQFGAVGLFESPAAQAREAYANCQPRELVPVPDEALRLLGRAQRVGA